jgi:leucyl aminopeptidase
MIELSIKSGSPDKQRTASVVVGLFENRKMTPEAEYLDRVSTGYLSKILRHGDMDGQLGSTLLLHEVPNTLCDRVLLVGLGRERDFKENEYKKVVQTVIRKLNELGGVDASVYLTEIAVRKRELPWKVEHFVLATYEAFYRFEFLKSQSKSSPRSLKRLTIHVPSRADLTEGEEALQRGIAIGEGMNLAKDLGNMPANFCTPTYLAETAQELSREHANLQVQVLEKEEIEKIGMGSFLAVAKGSQEPPKFIIMQYQGSTAEDPPYVLVGKGITFDSGGISIKPSADMDEMKFDMCGAAATLGTIRAVAKLQLPLNLVGLVPACENLPDGKANKPGDVLTTLSGQTVEVLNTDAEGRLILCDALTYAERFNPRAVIDIATLTGACVIALGHHASGLFSNQDGLARALLHAAEQSWDRAWRMPLWEDYHEALKSNFADFANVGGRAAGSITAACFLANFTKKYHWAHIDIAGTAYRSGKEKGATGRPVPLLVHYLSPAAVNKTDEN